MTRYVVKRILAAAALAAIALTVVACESDAVDTFGDASTPRPLDAPTALPTATSLPALQLDTATPLPTAPPLPTIAIVEPAEREIGEYDGVVFVVAEGSEATFTVTEQLAGASLPNDAVMRTDDLTGEVRLDGGVTEVTVDMHSLTSDQANRDRYVRTRMFPNHPEAVFTVPSIDSLPAGAAEGEEVTTQVTGTLSIREVTAPITFDIEARDDGDEIYILGRAIFTWQELEITPPKVGPVTSIEDEVRVEVLLRAVPGG